MKKRIRKTGEIVDVISYTDYGYIRTDYDRVSYIDSKGNEIQSSLNFYWDFENIDEELITPINWEQRRYEIAKEMLPMLSERRYRTNGVFSRHSRDEATNEALLYADALIEKLKKGV